MNAHGITHVTLARVAGQHLSEAPNDPQIHPIFAALLRPFSPEGQADLRQLQQRAPSQPGEGK